jgi:DoxX-like family
MFGAYVVVVVITLVINAVAAAADFSHARFVLANSADVGVGQRWLPLLGALKAAGAAGLLIGLLWLRPIGIAASIGLVLFFIGAMATHIRASVFHNLAFPGAFLALAGASLALFATR